MYIDVPQGSLVLEPDARDALKDAMLYLGKAESGPFSEFVRKDFTAKMRTFAKVLYETQGVEFGELT